MLFPAYNSDAIRVLSAALSDTLDTLRKSSGRPLTETETSDFSKKLAANLMAAFDDGTREPAALRHAGLHELYVSWDKAMSVV